MKEKRIAILQMMNDIIIEEVGDEDIYDLWFAIGVPDGATYDDYEWVADNDEEFMLCTRAFYKCIEMSID